MSLADLNLTCAQTPMSDRDVADAHRIAATIGNPTAHIGAHLDCADQYDTLYRADDDAARARMRAEHTRWAAVYTLAAALQAFAGCTWCQTEGCIATHRVTCQAEDGGDQIAVGAGCIEDAARAMESSAIHRISPVLVEELDDDDYRRLGVDIVREPTEWDLVPVAGLDLGDDALDLGHLGGAVDRAVATARGAAQAADEQVRVERAIRFGDDPAEVLAAVRGDWARGADS